MQVRQPLSQVWQTPSESAYVPALQAVTHDVPCLYGFPDEQVTQSVDVPPLQVAQSESQVSQSWPLA